MMTEDILLRRIEGLEDKLNALIYQLKVQEQSKCEHEFRYYTTEYTDPEVKFEPFKDKEGVLCFEVQTIRKVKDIYVCDKCGKHDVRMRHS